MSRLINRLSICLCMAMCFWVGASAYGSLTVNMTDATGLQGSTGNTVKVNLAEYTDGVDLTTVSLKITYDSNALSIPTDDSGVITSYTELNDGITKNDQISTNTLQQDGTAIVLIANIGTLIAAGDVEGDLFSFDFSVAADATPGDYALDIAAADSSVENLNGVVETTFNDGTFTVLGVDPVVSDATVNLAENVTNGDTVHQVQAVDAQDDIKASGGYAITAGDSMNAFEIDDSGKITVAGASKIDFETTTSYSLTVQVTDDAGHSGTGTITVNITDVNEMPVVAADQSFSIAEDQSGNVGTVNASDVDAGDSVESFAIVSGDDNSVFEIASDGTLSVAAGKSLDFETTSSYTLGITASDGNLTSSAVDVAVNVTNVNEAPVMQNVASTNDRMLVINDQATNTIDLTNYASDVDADDTKDNLSYTLEDTSALPAGVDATIDGSVITIDATDNDVTGNYEITYSSTDDGGLGSNVATAYLELINNQPPVATVATPDDAADLEEGASQDFSVTFSDAGNQPQDDGIKSVVWTVDGLAKDGKTESFEEAYSSPESGSFTLSTNIDDVTHDQGTVTVTVTATATDGQNVTNKQTWSFEVIDVNSVPVIQALKINAADTEGEEVSISKTEEIASLTAVPTISDADSEDFANGEPVGDDTVTYTWKMTRKGVNDGEAFTVEKIGGTGFAVLTEEEVNAALKEQGASENGFQDSDKYEVTLTVNDGVDSDTEMKSKTLGSAPWFPALEWDAPAMRAAVQAYYRVMISNDNGTVVTIFVVGNELKGPHYLAADWSEDYLADNVAQLKGLRPGTYSAVIEYRDEGAWKNLEEQSLTVEDYTDTGVTVALSDDGVNYGLNDDNNLWTLLGSYSNAAGYQVTFNGESSDAIQIPANNEGIVLTDAEVVFYQAITQSGVQTMTLKGMNPMATSEAADIEVTVEGAPAVNTKKPQAPVTYNLHPDTGLPGAQVAVDAETGKATVKLSWDSVQWADDYFILVQDVSGNVVQGLDRKRVPATDASRIELETILMPGSYRWYVIARNENGLNDWSNAAEFAVFDNMGMQDTTPGRVNLDNVADDGDVATIAFDADNDQVTLELNDIIANTYDKAELWLSAYEVDSAEQVFSGSKMLDDVSGNETFMFSAQENTLDADLDLKHQEQYMVQVKVRVEMDDVWSAYSAWSKPRTATAFKAGAALLDVELAVDQLTLEGDMLTVSLENVGTATQAVYSLYLADDNGAQKVMTAVSADLDAGDAFMIDLSDIDYKDAETIYVTVRVMDGDSISDEIAGKVSVVELLQ